MESSEDLAHSVIYMTTPALADKDGEWFVGDGEADFEKSTGKLNEMGQEGWELIVVDLGVAYWKMDLAEHASAFTEEERCGTCLCFDGNMCSETGFSADDNSLPYKQGCYKPRE